jgi:hypothetical protein
MPEAVGQEQKKRRLWSWRGFDVPEKVVASRKKRVSMAKQRGEDQKSNVASQKTAAAKQPPPSKKPVASATKSSSNGMDLESDDE